MTMMNISLLEMMKEFGVSRLEAGQYGSLRTDSFQQKLPFRGKGQSGVFEVWVPFGFHTPVSKTGYTRKNLLVISANNPKTKRLDEEGL
jgi:hypothetical protein